MPAKSEAQRRMLNAKFGHKWVKTHHFDNHGKLPNRVGKTAEWLDGVLAKTADVVAHIGGASGAGKTTLLDQLQAEHPGLATEDVDHFDYKAKRALKFPMMKANPAASAFYTDDKLKALRDKRQELMDNWLNKQKKPVVLSGIDFEGKGELGLDIPARMRLMLNTWPSTATYRAYKRDSVDGSMGVRDIPRHYRDNRDVYKGFRQHGYAVSSPEDIKTKVREYLARAGAAKEAGMSEWTDGLFDKSADDSAPTKLTPGKVGPAKGVISQPSVDLPEPIPEPEPAPESPYRFDQPSPNSGPRIPLGYKSNPPPAAFDSYNYDSRPGQLQAGANLVGAGLGGAMAGVGGLAGLVKSPITDLPVTAARLGAERDANLALEAEHREAAEKTWPDAYQQALPGGGVRRDGIPFNVMDDQLRPYRANRDALYAHQQQLGAQAGRLRAGLEPTAKPKPTPQPQQNPATRTRYQYDQLEKQNAMRKTAAPPSAPRVMPGLKLKESPQLLPPSNKPGPFATWKAQQPPKPPAPVVAPDMTRPTDNRQKPIAMLGTGQGTLAGPMAPPPQPQVQPLHGLPSGGAIQGKPKPPIIKQIMPGSKPPAPTLISGVFGGQKTGAVVEDMEVVNLPSTQKGTTELATQLKRKKRKDALVPNTAKLAGYRLLKIALGHSPDISPRLFSRWMAKTAITEDERKKKDSTVANELMNAGMGTAGLGGMGLLTHKLLDPHMETTKYINDANARIHGTQDPTERVLAYADMGRALGKPAYGDTTPKDILSHLFTKGSPSNVMAAAVHPKFGEKGDWKDTVRWREPTANDPGFVTPWHNHYDEMAKGPLAGIPQLAREFKPESEVAKLMASIAQHGDKEPRPHSEYQEDSIARLALNDNPDIANELDARYPQHGDEYAHLANVLSKPGHLADSAADVAPYAIGGGLALAGGASAYKLLQRMRKNRAAKNMEKKSNTGQPMAAPLPNVTLGVGALAQQGQANAAPGAASNNPKPTPSTSSTQAGSVPGRPTGQPMTKKPNAPVPGAGGVM